MSEVVAAAVSAAEGQLTLHILPLRTAAATTEPALYGTAELTLRAIKQQAAKERRFPSRRTNKTALWKAPLLDVSR